MNARVSIQCSPCIKRSHFTIRLMHVSRLKQNIVISSYNRVVSLLSTQHLVPNPVRMEGPAQLLTLAPVM